MLGIECGDHHHLVGGGIAGVVVGHPAPSKAEMSPSPPVPWHRDAQGAPAQWDPGGLGDTHGGTPEVNAAWRKPQLDTRPRQLRPPQPGPEPLLQNANRPPTPGRFPWGGGQEGAGTGPPRGGHRSSQTPRCERGARRKRRGPWRCSRKRREPGGWHHPKNAGLPQRLPPHRRVPHLAPGCLLPAQAGMPQLFPGPRPQTSLPWGHPRLQGGFMVRGSSPHRARAARARPTQQPRCLLAKQPGRSQKCWHQPGCSRRHRQDGQASP